MKAALGVHMELPSENEKLILDILRYWLEQWDFECPTLFGIEESDLEQVISEWPNGFRKNEKVTTRAVSHSFIELLWGASAISETNSLAKFGKSKNDIETLYNEIHNEVKIYRDE